MHQGDERDSSDEEWDEHIGNHGRAFFGLHEPVVEIALDEGVGIGMMVRNAFARADDIHMRASLAESSYTPDQDASPAAEQSLGFRLSVGDGYMNAAASDADGNVDQPGQLSSSSADISTNLNSTSNLGMSPSTSGDTEGDTEGKKNL